MQKTVSNDFADAFAHSGSEKLRKLAADGELRIEDEEFFSGGHLTRYRIHNSYHRGLQEIVQLAPGFSVITTSFEALELQTTSYIGKDWVVLQCCVLVSTILLSMMANRRDYYREIAALIF